MAGTKVGSMFVEFGIQGEEKFKDFTRGIGQIPVGIAATVAAFAGMSLSIVGLTDDFLNMTSGLRDFGATTGANTDVLEKWEMAARRVGLANEVVQGSFERIIQGQAKLKTGQADSMSRWFGQIGSLTGVNIDWYSGKPDQIMAQLRQAYQVASQRGLTSQFTSLAGNLIDTKMERLFQSSMSSPQSIAGMDVLYGKRGQEAAAELNREFSTLADELRKGFIPLLESMMPALKEITGYLVQWAEWLTHTKLDPMASAIAAGQRTRASLDAFLTSPIKENKFDLFMDKLFNVKSQGINVNQHFYGDVDKSDIDAGVLDLRSTLIHTARLMNKSGS